MMNQKVTSHIIHGSKNDADYVSEKSRKCRLCRVEKILRWFYYKANGEVTVDCRECIEKTKKQVHAERAKEKAQG